jgi:photosystem II stability/assembly factor-like uncharacterized protein
LTDPALPYTVYAATSANGVFVTTDQGATWSNSNLGLTSLAITSLAEFSPLIPGELVLYAGTVDSGVFKSLDRGSTWAAASNGLTNPSVSAIAVDPQGVAVYVATRAGIFRSADGGATWTSVSAALAIWSLAIDPTGSVFAGATDVILKTTDGGATWSTVFALPNPGSNFQQFDTIAIDPFSPSTVYAGSQYVGPQSFRGTGGLLKRTTDGGATWTAFAQDHFILQQIYALAIDPSGPGRMYVATGDLFVTSDSGLTWQAELIPSAVQTLALAYIVRTTVYAGTSSGGVFLVGSCAPDLTSVCLNASRFRVQVTWFDQQGASMSAHGLTFTSYTGAFWFFYSPNIDLVVKVLDARSVNSSFWVFWGSLTNVPFTITVEDMMTGAIRTYTSEGPFIGGADTSAF